MNCEILCVGSELLLGSVVNTNAAFLSQELSTLGINVYHHSVVGDNPDRLKDAVAIALSRSDLVITTGGLGPTYDDLTKETVAEALGLKMVLHQDILHNMLIAFRHYGKDFPKNNEKQAYFPQGATILPNDWGSAPSCAIEHQGKTVIMLPGPPSETKNIWNKYAKAYLEKKSDSVLFSVFCRIYGIGESALEERLADLLKNSLNPTVAPYASASEVVLRVTAKAKTVDEARALVMPVVEQIRAEVGDCLYTTEKNSMAEVVFDLLKEKNLTLAVAEDATCALFTKQFGDIDKDAQALFSGCVLLNAQARQNLLKVDNQADEAADAAALAAAIKEHSGCSLGLAIGKIHQLTDEAGTPLATVQIALDGPYGTKTIQTPPRRRNDRANFDVITVTRALDFLRRYLLNIQL